MTLTESLFSGTEKKGEEGREKEEEEDQGCAWRIFKLRIRAQAVTRPPREGRTEHGPGKKSADSLFHQEQGASKRGEESDRVQ